MYSGTETSLGLVGLMKRGTRQEVGLEGEQKSDPGGPGRHGANKVRHHERTLK